MGSTHVTGLTQFCGTIGYWPRMLNFALARHATFQMKESKVAATINIKTV